MMPIESKNEFWPMPHIGIALMGLSISEPIENDKVVQLYFTQLLNVPLTIHLSSISADIMKVSKHLYR